MPFKLNDTTPLSLTLESNAPATSWSVVYWGGPVSMQMVAAGPSFNLNVAVVQPVAGAAGQLREAFNITVTITQAVAAAAGAIVAAFNLTAAIAQSVTIAAGQLRETFNITTTATQAVATVAAEITNVAPGVSMNVAIVQEVAIVDAQLENVPPPETPYAPPRIVEWKPPLRVKRTVEVAVVQQVTRPRAVILVTPKLRMAVAIEQPAPRAAASIETGDAPEVEELLLL